MDCNSDSVGWRIDVVGSWVICSNKLGMLQVTVYEGSMVINSFPYHLPRFCYGCADALILLCFCTNYMVYSIMHIK